MCDVIYQASTFHSGVYFDNSFIKLFTGLYVRARVFALPLPHWYRCALVAEPKNQRVLKLRSYEFDCGLQIIYTYAEHVMCKYLFGIANLNFHTIFRYKLAEPQWIYTTNLLEFCKIVLSSLN